MATISQNRVIHRFIRPISDYQENGDYFTQVIPVDTQAYAYYPEGERTPNLWYVFGDGIHTYVELCEGKGEGEQNKEFPVFTADLVEIINNIDNTYVKKDEVYTKTEVDELIAEVPTFDIKIVEELPQVGQPHILYLTPGDESDPEPDNWYYEYLWVDGHWELIGNTRGGSIDPKDLVAEKIEYNYGTITNVQEALDLLMSYKPHIEPGEDEVVEEGSTVKDVTLSWEINKPLVSITIQPGDIHVDPTATTYTIKNANINETTTYTIEMNDGKNIYETEQTVIFAQKLYNGTSQNTTVDNTQILDFDQYFETTETGGECDFDCDGGKYFFICIPTEKADNVEFKINGFVFTDMIREDREFTNASGYTSSYSIFRCNNLQHAQSINVEYFYNE